MIEKYINKNYVVEIMLSKKFENSMDVNVEVKYQVGGHVCSDNWNEAYCSINEFKKKYNLNGKDNVFIWRGKE